MPSNASKENSARLRSFKNLSKDKDVSCFYLLPHAYFYDVFSVGDEKKAQ